MGIDREDPKELESLKVLAQQELDSLNDQRVTILGGPEGTEERIDQYRSYLTDLPKDLASTPEEIEAAIAVLESLSYDLNLTLTWIRDDRFGPLRSLARLNRDPRFNKIENNPFFLDDYVSRIRSYAIIFKGMTGAEPKKFFEGGVARSLISTYRAAGEKTPERLRFLVSSAGQDLRSLEIPLPQGAREFEDLEMQQLIDQGVEPAIAKRRIQTETEKWENEFSKIRASEVGRQKRLFDIFIDKYPDPRIFIDKVLGVTPEGKLPV